MAKIEINNHWFGSVTGVIIPVLVFLLVYKVREQDMELREFVQAMYYAQALPKLMSLCLLPDLILFYFYLRIEKLHAAKGVIFSLFIHAVPILAIKYL